MAGDQSGKVKSAAEIREAATKERAELAKGKDITGKFHADHPLCEQWRIAKEMQAQQKDATDRYHGDLPAGVPNLEIMTFPSGFLRKVEKVNSVFDDTVYKTGYDPGQARADACRQEDEQQRKLESQPKPPEAPPKPDGKGGGAAAAKPGDHSGRAGAKVDGRGDGDGKGAAKKKRGGHGLHIDARGIHWN